MKFFAALIIFAFAAFPGFSQTANSQRFKALADSMERTATNSRDKLAEFDDLVADDGATKNYTQYRRKYDSMTNALRQSETRLDFLIRTYDRGSKIKKERDNYERLVKQMEDLNSEYANWQKNRK